MYSLSSTHPPDSWGQLGMDATQPRDALARNKSKKGHGLVALVESPGLECCCLCPSAFWGSGVVGVRRQGLHWGRQDGEFTSKIKAYLLHMLRGSVPRYRQEEFLPSTWSSSSAWKGGGDKAASRFR